MRKRKGEKKKVSIQHSQGKKKIDRYDPLTHEKQQQRNDTGQRQRKGFIQYSKFNRNLELGRAYCIQLSELKVKLHPEPEKLIADIKRPVSACICLVITIYIVVVVVDGGAFPFSLYI